MPSLKQKASVLDLLFLPSSLSLAPSRMFLIAVKDCVLLTSLVAMTKTTEGGQVGAHSSR